MSSTSNQRSPVSTQNMDTSCSNSSSSTSSISLVMLTAHTNKHTPPHTLISFPFLSQSNFKFCHIITFSIPTTTPYFRSFWLFPSALPSLSLTLSLTLCLCIHVCLSYTCRHCTTMENMHRTNFS